MAEQLFKEELSAKEKLYREAQGLEEAASLILRFERKEKAFLSAARKYAKLEEYKNAKEASERCKKKAEEARKEGSRLAYEMAQKKQESARTKSDYVDAIEEYKRVFKMDEYAKESRKKIAECKAAIMRIQKVKVWKARGIVAACLAAMLILFVQTKAYPLAKGMVHKMLGDYKAAINNYKEADGFLGANGGLKSAYYEYGKELLSQGQRKKALYAFIKAGSYSDASAYTAKLEKQFIKKGEIGDTVLFGEKRWLILDKDTKKVFLLQKRMGQKMVYDKGQKTNWDESDLKNWLNGAFVKEHFSEEECAMLIEQYYPKRAQGAKKPQWVLCLSSTEYEKYKKQLIISDANWWLRDDGTDRMGVKYVNANGEIVRTYPNNTKCHVRPAVWVNYTK